MTVTIQTDSPELAPQSADPLDHLTDILFFPMGTDGVCARTALYEDMVERLAALITRQPAHTGCVAFGMGRLAVAMFHTHGTDLAKWPVKVREIGLRRHATADGHVEGWR